MVRVTILQNFKEQSADKTLLYKGGKHLAANSVAAQ